MYESSSTYAFTMLEVSIKFNPVPDEQRFRRSRIGLTVRAVPKLASVLGSPSAEPRLGIFAWHTLVACFRINSLAVPRYEIHPSP